MLPSLLQSASRCWLTSAVLFVFVLHLSSVRQSHASSLWTDPEPNLVSKDSYSNFRSFQGAHFGSMTLSLEQRLLMVGAQNSFYVMDLDHPIGSKQGIRNYTWISQQSVVDNCLMKGIEQWECQNFIEVLQPNPAKNNSLFVCGTNAQTPLCRDFSDMSLSRYQESDGTFICPFNPTQEGTALFADGNLYTGVARDYTARDSVIFRSTSDSPSDNALFTKPMDTKWLKIPSFVKSFDVGDWVMFFFREVAVEYTSGDAVYSRVAKVCKSDQGGEWISQNQWTTFQKTRLNCSFPGAFPFYFNFLQDVHMVQTENDTLFYGVFTTGSHEIPGSAVCVFSLKTITTIMNEGEFKEQQGGAWYPASPSNSYPRPGICGTTDLPSQSTIWITTHPLMHESVPNHDNPFPIFDLTRADFRITQLVVHTKKAEDGDYRVLFLGSDDSRILKVVLVPGEGGAVHANLLEEIRLHPENSFESVVNMELVTNHEGKEALIVNTNSSILEVPLQRCTNYTKRCGCVQDPYCAWNGVSNECYIYTGENSYDDQDVSNIVECPALPLKPPTTIASQASEASAEHASPSAHKSQIALRSEDPPPPTTPQPECICETTGPTVASTSRYSTTATTTTTPTTTATPTTPGVSSTRSTASSTNPDQSTSLKSSSARIGDHDSWKSTDGMPDSSLDNDISEGKLTPSVLPSTTINNAIGPLVISDVDILEVATAIPNVVEGIHGDKHLNRPDVLEYPQKNFSLLEENNVLVLVFLIVGWILFIFCGFVVLYQCYHQHRKGTYQPTRTEDSILSASIKAKKEKEHHHSTLSPNGKLANGTLTEAPWSHPSRSTHTPAGRERDSLGPVNGQSLPRRPMAVPTPQVPPSYRSPVPSYAHTVGSLPSPARINKYMNGKSSFNSLDRHRTPAVHNLYVESPRTHLHEPYSSFGNGRAMTAEDRRPSGASDSEMYDDDVWQPRMEGEELV